MTILCRENIRIAQNERWTKVTSAREIRRYMSKFLLIWLKSSYLQMRMAWYSSPWNGCRRSVCNDGVLFVVQLSWNRHIAGPSISATKAGEILISMFMLPKKSSDVSRKYFSVLSRWFSDKVHSPSEASLSGCQESIVALQNTSFVSD